MALHPSMPCSHKHQQCCCEAAVHTVDHVRRLITSEDADALAYVQVGQLGAAVEAVAATGVSITAHSLVEPEQDVQQQAQLGSLVHAYCQASCLHMCRWAR